MRRSKGRRHKYDKLDFQFLIDGPHGVPCQLTAADDAGDNEAIKAAWRELPPAIMREWFHTHAGCRPWAWWQFVGHEHGRRERKDGKTHPFDNKARTLTVANADNPRAWRQAYSLRFGMPAIFIPPHDEDLYRDFMANILHGKPSVVFEPEWSFLVRHNLLRDEDSP
jgi:hypothetical protein